jgi:hypothetical protein
VCSLKKIQDTVDGKGLEAVLSRATITTLLGNGNTLNEKYKTYTFPFLTRLGTLFMKYGPPRRAEKVLIERKSSHLSQRRSRAQLSFGKFTKGINKSSPFSHSGTRLAVGPLASALQEFVPSFFMNH